ncbi:hypothetical protein JZU48_04115, partial [bacterium]|nr:hypothetical protein [bacterium]
RAAAVNLFDRRGAELKADLDKLNGLGAAAGAADQMTGLLAETTAAAKKLDGEVRRRLDAAAKLNRRKEELAKVHAAFLNQFRPMVRSLTLRIQGVTMDLPTDAGGLTMLVLALVSKDLPVRQALSDIIGDINLTVTLLSAADAAKWADVVMMLTPDELQGDRQSRRTGKVVRRGGQTSPILRRFSLQYPVRRNRAPDRPNHRRLRTGSRRRLCIAAGGNRCANRRRPGAGGAVRPSRPLGRTSGRAGRIQ